MIKTREPEFPARMFKLAGQTFAIELPDRASWREDIANAAVEAKTGQLGYRVCVATLFLCAPILREQPVSQTDKRRCPRYEGDLLKYGGEVIDFLGEVCAAANVPMSSVRPELIAAGNAAVQLVIDSMVDEGDLLRAVGNSPGPEAGPSESRSPSRGTTG